MNRGGLHLPLARLGARARLEGMTKFKRCASLVLLAIVPLSVAAARARSKARAPARSSAVQPAPAIADAEGAAGLEERARLRDKLKAALAGSGFAPSELGLWVGMRADVGAINVVYSQNERKPFVPASLSKLATAAAALHAMEPSHKFRTQLMATAEPSADGALAGSLYLVGGGDPSFVSENMWSLVNDFTRSGATLVAGDVVVDDSRFDAVRFDEDREDARVDRAYDAPIGAMSMNWNSVNVYVRPGPRAGAPARVFADPPSGYLKVRNLATTGGRAKTISVERKDNDAAAGVDLIVVSGQIPLGAEEAVVYKNVTKPDLWSGYQLVEFLKQRGISVKGGVRVGAAPAGAKVLAFNDSKPLVGVVADMAKWSNNYVAEMLAKNIAAETGQRPATMKTGIAKINRYLNSLGLSGFAFVNASGFTRDNRFTPEQLGRLLETARADFTIFPEFLSALPVAGVDGTLRNRIKSSAGSHWVRAKTGLLNGAVGLAGFAGRPRGRAATFVFIYNGSGREDKARALFDRLAATLADDD